MVIPTVNLTQLWVVYTNLSIRVDYNIILELTIGNFLQSLGEGIRLLTVYIPHIVCEKYKKDTLDMDSFVLVSPPPQRNMCIRSIHLMS